ncbi:GNAT family N-acetyltransferase [Aliivibrio finisterrensis]|uniref:GNAT family N-acetyltransferase n=1 Tax=Aliivibrio finisterrensis TaxID=511998 RepID=UPI0010204627|nr:GNAT family N-acetyltransferase [Aliivibrio finisterrensis]RYU67839.1 GNAT family N-acetyltransferase [Aliivibrio finisterrensis]RYU71498.1 GNAT family N-acetyltransferase [Aliivibrio finisterrensis]RYU74660.1 GNAT family N-acetyltransferase [Aliivibrio finisterrensis]
MCIKIGSASELNISIKEVTSFYDCNWTRKIALSNENFYQWQFISTPNNNNDDCCVAIDENEIIAVMGLHERPFHLNQKEYSGAELTTWIVHKDKRNLGLGPKMIDYLQSKYDVLFGMGISKDALPVYLRKGFKYIKSIPRYIYPINYNSIETFGHYTPLAKKLSKIRGRHEIYTIIKHTENELNILNSVFSSNANFFNRSEQWINWRYEKHPSFNYIINVISNNKGNKCVVVYRIDHLKDLTIMHCLDIYGEYNAFSSGISYLEDTARNNNVDIIDFYSTNSKVNSAFIHKNWFPTLDFDFIDFPHLFHPIEMRTPSTTSLILWFNDDCNLSYDFGKLYITKQDCDFDRPVENNMNLVSH